MVSLPAIQYCSTLDYLARIHPGQTQGEAMALKQCWRTYFPAHLLSAPTPERQHSPYPNTPHAGPAAHPTSIYHTGVTINASANASQRADFSQGRELTGVRHNRPEKPLDSIRHSRTSCTSHSGLPSMTFGAAAGVNASAQANTCMTRAGQNTFQMAPRK